MPRHGQYEQYEQYERPEASERSGRSGQSGRSGPQEAAPEYPARRAAGRTDDWDDEDSDDPMAAFSERWRRRGEEDPENRRGRWRLLMAGGGVVAIAIAVGVYFLIGGGSSGTNTGIGSLVTSFLPGELQKVPNACATVPSSTLGKYLPGQTREAAPPANTGAQSQCTWTLDKSPTYRVLEVNLNAYSPSTLATGDGSATFAAEDAYSQAESAKKKPGAHSGQPAATVATIPNLGSSAFSATQVFTTSGNTTDVATVYVRYHNVVIQVVLDGIDHSNGPRQYGPVSMASLLSQAKTVAQQVTSKVSGG